ncbi:MAG: hypothetical protein GX267_12670 [Fibrobacter sp.]|jgi:hypothetical protein|nr:hypothetical protein [Fibrobacter sp.]
MIVQGPGLQSYTQPKTSLKSLKGQQKATGIPLNKEKDTVELSGIGLERFEHLLKIRQKIQNGFYNSDSVLEDISHGLAKALDPQ